MPSRDTSRLHVEGPLESNTEVVLENEQSHYIHRVLRLRPGDELTVFDGRGGEYPARIAAASKTSITVALGAHVERESESPLAVDLVQGIGRGDRMDVVVQKSTELGIRRITPVITRYSVVRLDAKRGEKRMRHWIGIARSACEQCGRNRVPSIDAPRPFADWLTASRDDGKLRLVLEPTATSTFAACESPPSAVELLVGPEGGFSGTELEAAVAAGFTACAFGPRTLRTETAALAAIAVLQARWGDLL